jgi:hypothetical protein
MPTYVQAPGSDSWHWCENCTSYPSNIAKRETHPGKERPKSGELDDQCKAKERNGDCDS